MSRHKLQNQLSKIALYLTNYVLSTHNYYDYTKPIAVVATHLDDFINEAQVSDGVSLLYQDLLEMLHLKSMQQRKCHDLSPVALIALHFLEVI